MKTNTFSVLALTGILLLAIGCADETATQNHGNNDQQNDLTPEDLTAFCEEATATRTTGEYDGSGINFYWTAGDRLWVNNGGTLIQDANNTINSNLKPNPANSSAVKRAATAKFYFNGNFTANSYPVRYTGKNGAAGKVTIKASQRQTVPNDASHIGEDGDFAVATAAKPIGSGKYYFTLTHKASYVTFLPYTNQSVVSSAILQKISIYTGNTSDKLAGTFDLADDGTLSNPTSTSNRIELDTKSTPWSHDGLSIPTTPTYTANAVTMVVNPGTYSNVSIEYTLHDPITNTTGTITKTYPSLTFATGNNKRVSTNLQLPDYSPWLDDNYMWDAKKSYWYGKTLPAVLQNNVNYSSYGPPTSSDANRWYNTANSNPCNASNSCTIAPTVNELWYYARYGNPCWDSQKMWIFRGHLYTGGMWIKKQSVIYNDLKAAGYNQLTAQGDMKEKFYSSATDATGSDFRITFNATNAVASTTPPTNTANYFYIPAAGACGNGFFWLAGNSCFLWSSNGIPNDEGDAYFMSIVSHHVFVDRRVRFSGFYVRPVE